MTIAPGSAFVTDAARVNGERVMPSRVGRRHSCPSSPRPRERLSMTTQQRPDQTTSRAPLSRVVGDRAAQLREDPELMPRLLADPATRVLVVNNASVPLADADAPVLHLATVAETGLEASA